MEDETKNAGAGVAEPEVTLDPIKMREFQAKLEAEQNLPVGILAGMVAALIGAGVWAGVTVATGYQIGYLAIGVGFLVGVAVRIFGKGVTTPFAVAGCVLALAGCALGNVLSICGFVAIQESVPFMEIVSKLTPVFAVTLLKETFELMDALFYGIALYAGWQSSMRRMTPEEMQALLQKQQG
jgi:hypothetical protein